MFAGWHASSSGNVILNRVLSHSLLRLRFSGIILINSFMTVVPIISKSMDWFLYDRVLRHKGVSSKDIIASSSLNFLTQDLIATSTWRQAKKMLSRCFAMPPKNSGRPVKELKTVTEAFLTSGGIQEKNRNVIVSVLLNHKNTTFTWVETTFIYKT